MRLRLNLSDLYSEYHAEFLSNTNIPLPSQAERKEIWRARMLERYPDLEPCPICQNDQIHLEQLSSRGIAGYFNFQKISCSNCNLEFLGVSYADVSIVDQWNNRGKSNEKSN